MFRAMGRLVIPLAMAGGLLLLAPLFKATNIGGVAWADAQNSFNSEYFDDTVGGGTVSIINPTAASVDCALIYVFRSDEELEECCGCPVTHSGGLRTIRVATQLPEDLAGDPFTNHPPVGTFNTLTDNPLNGRFIGRGVIKILSSAPNGFFGNCDPTLAPVTPLLDSLREYGTAFQVSEFEFGGGVNDDDVIGVTEHSFQGAPDPTRSGEAANIQHLCAGIFATGSGKGICGCGRGDFFP